MGELWNLISGAVLSALASALDVLHDAVAAPVFGDEFGWGWAIVLLTIVVRILLIPLAIRQTRSMRAMQQLQPELKRIQKKYKVDRSLIKTDPEKFRAQQNKQREELSKLYSEHGVSPAGGCLPLLLQMPIFFALFHVLRTGENYPQIAELPRAAWYGIDALGAGAGEAGIGAYLLIAGMVLTTFFSQKQLMARKATPQPARDDEDAPPFDQQKVMLYVMPVMLAVFSFQVPTGVLVYWVTTNLWTVAQQWWIVSRDDSAAAAAAQATAAAKPRDRASSSSGAKEQNRSAGKGSSRSRAPSKGTASPPAARRKGSADGSTNGRTDTDTARRAAAQAGATAKPPKRPKDG